MDQPKSDQIGTATAQLAIVSGVFFAAAFLLANVPLDPCITSFSTDWLSHAAFFVSGVSALGACLVGLVALIVGLVRGRRKAVMHGAVGVLSCVVIGSLLLGPWGPYEFTGRPVRWDGMAINMLRAINAAEMTYSSSFDGKYGTVDDLTGRGLLDLPMYYPFDEYRFRIVPEAKDYVATAERVRPKSGCWDYRSTADGVIHYSTKAPKGKSGQPIYN